MSILYLSVVSFLYSIRKISMTKKPMLQMGDRVTIVGSELAVTHAEKVLGNSMKRLNPVSYTHLGDHLYRPFRRDDGSDG